MLRIEMKHLQKLHHNSERYDDKNVFTFIVYLAEHVRKVNWLNGLKYIRLIGRCKNDDTEDEKKGVWKCKIRWQAYCGFSLKRSAFLEQAHTRNVCDVLSKLNWHTLVSAFDFNMARGRMKSGI